MPSPFQRLVDSLRDSTSRLNTPPYQAEARQQDLNPRNLYDIDQEMQRTPPAQQDALAAEKQRITQLQTQQIMQAARQFQPQLASMLELPKIPSISDVIMQMMQGRQRPASFDRINGQRPMWQFNQERHDQPFTPLGGVRS